MTTRDRSEEATMTETAAAGMTANDAEERVETALSQFVEDMNSQTWQAVITAAQRRNTEDFLRNFDTQAMIRLKIALLTAVEPLRSKRKALGQKLDGEEGERFFFISTLLAHIDNRLTNLGLLFPAMANKVNPNGTLGHDPFLWITK